MAAAELSALAAFTRPRDSQGKVTAATLFRGFTAGDLIGPYVSQLLLKPFSYGAALIGAGYKTELPLSQGGVVSRSWWKSEKASRSGELSHNSNPLGGGHRRMTLWRGIAGADGKEKARWKS